ncbi:antibiotic biosynthesis monooxygenase family protein [Streptomyces hirsutus]|uniref:antibiotic biosynthesis monooxygenase family protein n=1 Tax=Streptomyces hirsutus TaxID=35620 RepID=UPI0006E3651D
MPGEGGAGAVGGGPGGGVRVVVYQAAYDEKELAAVRAAYHRVSERLAEVPGMLGNELLRSPQDPSALAVLSRWESMEAFLAWEAGADHRQDTAPLRPFRDTRTAAPFAVYEVDATY